MIKKEWVGGLDMQTLQEGEGCSILCDGGYQYGGWTRSRLQRKNRMLKVEGVGN